MRVNLNLTITEMQMENENYDGVSVDEVVEWFGGEQVTLAKRLGVTKAAVSYWVSEGKIPANRAIQIELLTEGAIKAVDLPIIKR
jgi:DNA-binding transcriptional regulator YdaS (Cro superfamily)